MKADVPVLRCTVCDAPYLLRFALHLDGSNGWIYVRDCKHKAPPPSGQDIADVETSPLMVLRVSEDTPS